LRKRLSDFLPKTQAQASEPRPINDLLKRADEVETAEAKRLAEAARQRRIAEMKDLAAKEEQTWQQVDQMLDKGPKSASVYDQATVLLEKLHDLAEYRETPNAFRNRVQLLVGKYGSRPSLMDRWRKHGWI
jgi:hypothetical protein